MAAMWSDSDDAREWQQREKQRLNEEQRVWGRPPDEFR
jgi:hypothetical protein